MNIQKQLDSIRNDRIDRMKTLGKLKTRLDAGGADEGVWRTLENGVHIHISEEGVVDKGPSEITKAMNESRDPVLKKAKKKNASLKAKKRRSLEFLAKNSCSSISEIEKENHCSRGEAERISKAYSSKRLTTAVEHLPNGCSISSKGETTYVREESNLIGLYKNGKRIASIPLTGYDNTFQKYFDSIPSENLEDELNFSLD